MRPSGAIAAALAGAALLPGSAAAAPRVLWSNGGPPASIAWVTPGGGPTGHLASLDPRALPPVGLAIDAAGGRILWTSGTTIHVANLDGSGVVAELPTPGVTFETPFGLAIDPVHGRLYVSDPYAEKLFWVALDGSGGGHLNTTGATVLGPNGVAVDPAAGRLYWANAIGRISFARLDGSGGGDIPTGGAIVGGPVGVAVDPVAKRVYWADEQEDAISFARLDGRGGATIATGRATVDGPTGIAIDPGRRVVWANGRGGSIAWASPDGERGADLRAARPVIRPGLLALMDVPRAIVAPTVGGAAGAGSTLTCSDGSWAADLLPAQLYRTPQRLAYAWTHDGQAVAGATGPTLTAAAAGEYACTVVATNAAGSSGRTSPRVAVSPTPGEASPPPAAGAPRRPGAAPAPAPRPRLEVGPIRRGHVVELATTAGRVTISAGARIRPVSVPLTAGRYKLHFTLAPSAWRTLRRDRRLPLRIVARLAPADGGRRVVVRRRIVLRFGTQRAPAR